MARTTTVSMEALLKPTSVNRREGGMVVGNGSSLRRLPPVLSAALVGVPGRRINAAGLLFHRTGHVGRRLANERGRAPNAKGGQGRARWEPASGEAARRTPAPAPRRAAARRRGCRSSCRTARPPSSAAAGCRRSARPPALHA
jgi:hypothetical protein